MGVKQIWKTRSKVTVWDAAHLLNDMEPPPPSADLAPAAEEVLREILHLAKEHVLFSSFLEQAGQYNGGWFLTACDCVLFDGEPIQHEFFTHYTMERGECRAVAEALGLAPEFLEPERDTPDAPEQKRAPLSLETPEGTTWRDIRLVIRNNEYTEVLEVKGPGGHLGNYKPEVLGFGGHSGPGKLWKLLGLFARAGGTIEPQKYSAEYNFKPRVSRLRGALQKLFPYIEGNPIPWRAKERAWETAFSISLGEYHDE